MEIEEALLDGEEKMIKTSADFERQLKNVRTGQANPDLLEGLDVEVPAYGGRVNLKAVAIVAKQDAQMLVIKPFDPKIIKEIEKGIMASDLGITPSNDGKIIRLAFPPMSEERRKQTVKQLKDRLEQHKIAIRNVRKEMIKHIEGNKGQPGVSEDAIEAAKEETQSLTKKYEKELDDAFEKKSKEILTF